MDATTSREMEQLFAGLDAREQRELLEYARALRDGEQEEDEEHVHLMGSISRKDLRTVRESLEAEGTIGVVVLRVLGAFSVSDDDEDGEVDAEDGDGDAEDQGAEAGDASGDESADKAAAVAA